jgi:hypothetical protein
MLDDLLAAIVPFDSDASPIRFSDGTTVGLIVSPANAVSYSEKSGLVAGHCVLIHILGLTPILNLIATTNETYDNQAARAI